LETSAKQYRVVLAEDQTIVRQGIMSLLQLVDDIVVVGEAADGLEAVTAIQNHRPDVALLDIRMPRLSGIEVIREISGSENPVPAILLTTFDEDPLFLEAVQAGACGFLLKDISLERLTEAIRTVADGGTLLQPAVTERVIRIMQRRSLPFNTEPVPERLTPHQQNVLRLLAGGYSNREIAEALSMSEGTIKNSVSTILSKMGVRDRTRAVLRGIELGYF
ncbi:MAG: response regulator transcription factor, partial [Acidobacteriaceae bacterium]|nr:response regulator transcription factor [Acidobacteriaceae bacterium]